MNQTATHAAGNTDEFGTYHPALNFLMFACAIALGMFLRHPAFLVVGLALSVLYYLTIKRRKGIKVILGMIPVFVILSLLNPLFNTMGDTVLFAYFEGRPYTLEALCYGMCTAAMFVTMLMWFASYNAIMTSDKFTYLFGSIAPALSLVFTMVLRLVPTYQRKASQFATARSCIGKSAVQGTNRDKVENGASVLSVLTTWAFENAVTVADSMRSRGYGLPGRTAYSLYRFDARDAIMLAAMVVLAGAAVAAIVFGAADVEFYPVITVPAPTPLFWAGLVSYAAFLALPSIINIRESVVWRISLSRI